MLPLLAAFLVSFVPASAVGSTVVYTSTTTTYIGAGTTRTNYQYDAAVGASSTMGFLFIIVLVVGPALLFYGVTKSIWGGIFGATLGVTIGAIPPPQGPGFIPWFVVPLMVLVMLAMIFFGRRGSVGGEV